MTPPPSVSAEPAQPRRPRTATRAGGDRRPYPTAPTLTRSSPARDGAAHPPARGSGEPTPSTVWLCDTELDTDGSGLDGVVTTILTSFSSPGGRVGLLAWPAPPTLVDAASGESPSAATLRPLASAMAAATAADRVPVLLMPWSVAVESAGPSGIGALADPSPRRRAEATRHDQSCAIAPDPGPLDLIITVVEPGAVDDTTAASATLAAARALRRGGILTVLTHCDRRHGVLIDPGGLLVTAGQNADLLYLQHIVAVHAPIREGHIHPFWHQTAGEDHDGRPEIHCRVHSDLYVLAQQQDHHGDPLNGVDPSRGADR